MRRVPESSASASIAPSRPYRSTKAEQETVIRWDRADDQVHVWSASPLTWRRMARLGIRPVRETTCQSRVSGRFYRIPVARFRWGLKRAGVGVRKSRLAVQTAA